MLKNLWHKVTDNVVLIIAFPIILILIAVCGGRWGNDEDY